MVSPSAQDDASVYIRLAAWVHAWASTWLGYTSAYENEITKSVT